MKETKENGITLIALIVTVIILLILAGVSISMVSGDGLFSKARSASETYKAAANNETKILEEYENFMQEYTTGGSTTPTTPTYASYTLGQEVTIGTGVNAQKFYVIESSDSSSSTVKLLAAKCINESSNLQSDDYSKVAFALNSTSYESSNVKTIVDNYVATLGLVNVQGTLPSVNDVNSLGFIWGDSSSRQTFAEGWYWTKSAVEGSATYIYAIANNNLVKTTSVGETYEYQSGDFSVNNGTMAVKAFGVRPVITVNKNEL